ncbi:G4 quadruplex nucleic acid binding protein [Malassezia psittaci]|uniref:G4 quadruplex nucleic acid binding protein n=1 Tax=Malassezia psittaci TaxID=1821823 RepID=A0AAF0F9T2_9BASI|nr:G4 quadruplex nucleic acid binding protein [Malassezia psittaci]
MAQRIRQLLADVYARLVPDKTALASLNRQSPLRTYVKDLAALTSAPEQVLGANDDEVKRTNTWLDEVEGMNGSLETLDQKLSSCTFLSGNTPTAADYSLFASLYDIVSTLPPAAQHAHPSLTRYFSHMSHLSAGAQVDPPVTTFEPEFENFPTIQRAQAVNEKKEKKQKESQQSASSQPTAKVDDAVATSTQSAEASKPAKNKQAKPPKQKGGNASTAAPDSKPVPSMVDMRVGKIVDIQRHPDADSLYLERVDFGEPDGPRTILSGLVHYVPMDQMKDRWVVGICNLKPVAMRGIKSYGMLLCATHKDGKEHGIEPVQPPTDSQVGDRIFVEGYENLTPLEQLNPKKKIFETIQPNYLTTDDRSAAWYGPLPDGPEDQKAPRLLRTTRGVCSAPSFTGATLS